jgi:hypothetical protein
LQIHTRGGYGSEFDYDSEVDRKKYLLSFFYHLPFLLILHVPFLRQKRHDLADASEPAKSKVPSKAEVTAEYTKYVQLCSVFPLFKMVFSAGRRAGCIDFISSV